MPFNDDELERREISQMIREIYQIVVGSEHDKQNSMLVRMRTLEADFVKVNTFLERSKWLVIGMSLPASWGIVQLIVALFQLK